VLAWHRREADAAEAAGQWPVVLTHLDALIAATPANWSLQVWRGTVCEELGRLDEAIAAYKEAVRLRPDRVVLHLNLCLALEKKGRLKETIAACKEALKLFPNNAWVHSNLAWFLATCSDTRFRDPGQAVRLAKRAVELDPYEGNYWGTLGAAHYCAGEWQNAVAAFNKSLERYHPGFMVALTQGQVAAFYKSRELGKGGDIRFFLAMAHWQLGDQKQARKWFDQAVALMKERPQDEALRRFRAEAADLLGVKDQPAPPRAVPPPKAK
jgi:tetratricopeptide (TPR) repeat protein